MEKPKLKISYRERVKCEILQKYLWILAENDIAKKITYEMWEEYVGAGFFVRFIGSWLNEIDILACWQFIWINIL
jgi:hypothetical protein